MEVCEAGGRGEGDIFSRKKKRCFARMYPGRGVSIGSHIMKVAEQLLQVCNVPDLWFVGVARQNIMKCTNSDFSSNRFHIAEAGGTADLSPRG